MFYVLSLQLKHEEGSPSLPQQMSMCVFWPITVCISLILAKFLVGNIRQRNDLYLDELHTILSDRLEVNVDDSTIWKALQKRGFTMKKVCAVIRHRNLTEMYCIRYSRLAKRHLSVMRTDEQHSVSHLGETVIHTIPCLSTKAPLIDEPQSAIGPGHYVGVKLRGNVSLFVAAGSSQQICILID